MNIYKELELYTQYSFGLTEQKYELVYEDVDLEKIDFRKYDLNNSIFVGVTFNECNFSGVYLSGTLFGGSILKKCIFKNNILVKANWNFCEFYNCDIEELKACRTEFIETKFKNIIFVKGSLIK